MTQPPEATGPGRIPVAEVVRRIEGADDPAIFVDLVSRDELEATAAALADRTAGRAAPLPMEGWTFAVKDNIDVAGRRTTSALPRAAYRAGASAPVVDRLLGAGALLVGKANLDQLATGLVGVRSPYGVPRNPLDASRIPGGSSSGSAVAVARELVTFALGTDTAGSGRVPAACCGIVGLKPAPGQWPTAGVVPACPSLDCVSVFARTVEEATTVAGIVGRPWPAASGRLTAGVPAPRFLGDLDEEAAAGLADEVARLHEAGVEVVEVDMAPFFEAGDLLYEGALLAERTAAVGALLDGGGPTGGDRLDRGGVVDVVRRIVAGGRRYTAVEAFSALHRLDALRRTIAATVFSTVDVLVVPTVPTIPTLADVAADPVGVNLGLGRFTTFVNPLNLAALTAPTGPRADGLRGSATIVGPAGREPVLVTLGSLLTGEPTPGTGETAPPGHVDVAVVGAHLRGQPLNPALIERGGVLVSRTTTAPSYRLYHLDGGPPERPALERVDTRTRPIEVEVWRLDLAALGALTAEISSPLGIGTVELAGGRWVKGFVCEPHGLACAHDITEHGGWRAYLGAAAAPEPS